MFPADGFMESGCLYFGLPQQAMTLTNTMTHHQTIQDPLLQPFQLRHLSLRNRIISTAHAPSYAENGHPRDRYRLYHEEKAKGGVALTMIGGSTNIAPDSPSVFGQLYAGDDSIIPWFRKLTEAVKSHGAAIMCQITHMGRRTVGDYGHWLPVIGPSAMRERAHRSYPKPMEMHDIRRVIDDFSATALRCREGGFDGIELLSHSHLLGQFLSPLVNQRTDDYGGSLDNRLRFTLQVLEAVRERVGDAFIVGMRITADELVAGGIDAQQGIEIASRLEASGMVDFINVLAGAPYDDLGLAGWVSPMGLPSAPHLELVGALKAAISLPVFHAGGIADISNARRAVKQGLVDMVGMTRAQMADPYLVQKLAAGQEEEIRPCVGLGYCVDRVNQGKDALCGHNAATGREAYLPHRIKPGHSPGKKAVVVGGGPAGMEAARVLAERGHRVVLFEATDSLGGQLRLAAMGKTRHQIWGVADWLIGQLTPLDVNIRYNAYAEAQEILEENPELVVVATGGLPPDLAIIGAELAHSGWDMLYGQTLSGRVLVCDEQGNQPAAVVADWLAAGGAAVTFTTPDRAPLIELGPTTASVALRDLYRQGVKFQSDQELIAIRREAAGLVATLGNTLTGETVELGTDHVVVENGTVAMNEVYEALKPASRNLGAIDIHALAAQELQLPALNPRGSFDLVCIGDAVSSRNLHAAIYDALRICARW